jgi:alpha-1,6-mannosyltransferase
MLRNDEGERLGPGLRSLLLVLCGLVIFFCFALVVSMALNPKLDIIYNVKGVSYGGPLTLLGRWLSLGRLAENDRAVLYSLLMIILNLAYFGTLYLVRKDRRARITVLIAGGFVLFSMLLVFIPPVLSRDVYSYSFYGRAMTVYHSNPYLLEPVSHPHDVLFPLIGWRFQPSDYGPLFNFLSFAVSKAAGNNIAANVLGYKMLAFVFYAGSLPLVYSLTRRVSPGRENLAIAIAAWNPLMLLHILGGAHNDSVMVFFVILGLLLYEKDHAIWGLISVVLAVMVKAVAALALLPFLVLFLRDRRGKLIQGVTEAAACVIVIPALFYLPFWKGLAIFKPLRKVFGMSSLSSVPTLTRYVLTKILSAIGLASATAESLSRTLTHVFFLALFATLVLALLWKVRDYRSMLLSTAAILLAWFLTSGYILPWYLMLGLLVCAVSGWNATTGSTIAASGVFSLYRIPPMRLAHVAHIAQTTSNAGPTKPSFLLSIPFAIILVVWLVLGKPFSNLRRVKTGRETVT